MNNHKRLAQTSLELRNLARHPMPAPTIRFKDQKKESSRKACRQK
jgi:hypothetical protein